MNEFFVVKCDSLSVPSGGNVTHSTDGLTTKAYFTCLAGYTLSGSSTLTCGSDGSWDVQSPSCGGRSAAYMFIYLFDTGSFTNTVHNM